MQRDFIGRGLPFPFKFNRNHGLSLLGGPEKIQQAIWIVLSTAPNERLMLPEFGCGIHDLVFEANTAALRGVVREHVRDALLRWEPRIDVLDVRVETPENARNQLLIYLEYRIRATNAIYNLVYPFFLNEGIG
jgi:uncharacterized protein